MELRHLTPYLPYTPTIYTLDDDSRPVIQTIRRIYTHKMKYSIETSEGWDLEPHEIQLILRPMASLTKELLRLAGFETHIDYLTHELQNPKNKETKDFDGKPYWRISAAPYEMVEFLIKEKFDVFGLIELKQATNYDTL